MATETWLPFAVRLDGPRNKTGYPSIADRTLAQIEGEVDHSTEGPLTAALGELQKLTRQASWHFTVPKSGPPLQHYPLESIAWHTGLPGDRSIDTSLIGNLTLIGIEHVDWPDDTLNDNQLYWSVELTKTFRLLCPQVAAHPPTLRVNLWEHNWLSSTSCPSGLIPWPKKLAALEEEEMTPEERQWFSDQLASVVTQIKQRIDEQGGVRDTQAEAILTKLNEGGAGLTEDEVKQAVKDALAEGTG